MAARGSNPRSELRSGALASLPGVAVLLLDRDLLVTGWAGAVGAVLGIDPEDADGREVGDILALVRAGDIHDELRRALGGQTGVFDVRSAHASDRVLECRTAPLRGDGGDVLGVLAVSRDVTDERAAQAMLRDSERRYRLLVEESTDVISRQTPDGTYLWVSPSLRDLLGRQPSELVGHSIEEIVHPDDRDGVSELATRFDADLDVVRHTHRLRHRDGRWLWIETVLRALRDPRSGGVLELVGAGRDVTDRVIAEEALERSNAELGRFATIASHDLAEPLLLIRGYAEQLREEAAARLADADRHRLDVIVRNATRLQALVDTLLSHATVDRATVGHERVDLGRVLDDTVDLLAARIEATGAIVRRGPLASVPGDARLLGILLQNLISNAMKFRSERSPQIDVSCEPAGEGWLLVVADNGIGIAPADARRIFGMFERVDRARHPGLGLGLATAARIAALHGGTIAVDCTPGAGATFRVTLTTRREVS